MAIDREYFFVLIWWFYWGCWRCSKSIKITSLLQPKSCPPSLVPTGVYFNKFFGWFITGESRQGGTHNPSRFTAQVIVTDWRVKTYFLMHASGKQINVFALFGFLSRFFLPQNLNFFRCNFMFRANCVLICCRMVNFNFSRGLRIAKKQVAVVLRFALLEDFLLLPGVFYFQMCVVEYSKTVRFLHLSRKFIYAWSIVNKIFYDNKLHHLTIRTMWISLS